MPKYPKPEFVGYQHFRQLVAKLVEVEHELAIPQDPVCPPDPDTGLPAILSDQGRACMRRLVETLADYVRMHHANCYAPLPELVGNRIRWHIHGPDGLWGWSQDGVISMFNTYYFREACVTANMLQNSLNQLSELDPYP